MAEKIRVNFSGYVDVDINPELKKLLDKQLNTEDDEVYDEIGDEIYECIDKELYKKGYHGIEIDDWKCVEVLE